MKKSPTQLMKELKAISAEIMEIHNNDINDSGVPVNEEYKPCYDGNYNYEKNREKVSKLQKRERDIKLILNKFNNETKVEGYDLTVSEGLVKLGQLKSEITTLKVLSRRKYYTNTDYRRSSDTTYQVCYDIDKVNETLKNLQSEFSALQVSIDKTNLNSIVDC